MAIEKNSFKELGQKEIDEIGETPKKVEQNVMGLVHGGHFFGDVIELYFSRMIDLILSLFGADQEPEKK